MLTDKVALVTGATSGIGLGIAKALAAAGCHVALNDIRDTPETREIAASVGRDSGRKSLLAVADAGDAAAADAMFGEVERALGPVDILVNNAGIQFVAPVDEFPVEKWNAIIATNLTSCFLTIRRALPGMKAKKAGRVVNIASAHGLVASPFKTAYVSAKHGVMGLTKSVALEVAEQGITVNAICPGYVLTPLVEKQIDDQARVHGIPKENVIRDVILAPQPTKAFVTVEQVAALAVYLCGPMADQITGAALPIEGGWTAR